MDEILNREVAIMLMIKDYLEDKETIQEMFDSWEKINNKAKRLTQDENEMFAFQATLYLIHTLLSVKKVLKEENKEDLKYLVSKLEETTENLKKIINE